ncbi:MAG: NAD-dependent succinate-semialdehyde dehydrogenase [Bacteroidia bacterium]|jgi:succinate-semialdehyde dehydrogenase/glutarate-semialdehyde dehydrogenase|nr:NAD-dependent succinate-semialdehyde dehydrogenase [Bacteroidia bacterium]
MTEFISINPYTFTERKRFEPITDLALNEAIANAETTQQSWRNKTIAERASCVVNLGKLIEQHHERLATLASLEMGKTLAEAKLEVLKCKTACDYYATETASILEPQLVKHTDGRTVHISHEPLGVVLGIFPWNFPYWQIVRSAIPITMAGNTMLVKPAPNTPECALALQALFDEAGLGHAIQTVFASQQQVSQILADSRIAACTLTGSERAGSAVAAQAGKHIKKSVLELGGSDPFIVLEDADLPLVLQHAVSARFQNNGQSCIAAKRYIVHATIANQFIHLLTEALKKLKAGDPLDIETQLGPLARIDLKQKLEEQVNETIQLGATLLYQGEMLKDVPCYYPPTILSNVSKQSPAYQEELFGPVLSLFVVDSDEAAIALANDSVYGLGASVWTTNNQRGQSIAKALQAGQVFVNAVTRSHTAFPFGGVKKSGYGRELGPEGLKEFCYVKTIWS